MEWLRPFEELTRRYIRRSPASVVRPRWAEEDQGTVLYSVTCRFVDLDLA